MDILNLDGKIIFRPKNPGKGKNTYLVCNLIRFCYSYADWKDFGDEICDFVTTTIDDLPPKTLASELKLLIPGMRRQLKKT